MISGFSLKYSRVRISPDRRTKSMSNNGPDESRPPLARWLAEQTVAAELFEAIVSGAARAATESADALPTLAALRAYARRSDHTLVDPAIERAVQTNTAISRRYCNQLISRAQAFSPVAIAAANTPKGEPRPLLRKVGAWHVEVSAPRGLLPVLVLKLDPKESAPASVPAAIEAVHLDEEPVRLRLPEPINRAIQLPLSDGAPKLAAFHRLLTKVETHLFLL
jgi:hypothetical protein